MVNAVPRKKNKKEIKKPFNTDNTYLDHSKDHSKIYLAKKSCPSLKKKKERRNVNTFLEGKKIKKERDRERREEGGWKRKGKKSKR